MIKSRILRCSQIPIPTTPSTCSYCRHTLKSSMSHFHTHHHQQGGGTPPPYFQPRISVDGGGAEQLAGLDFNAQNSRMEHQLSSQVPRYNDSQARFLVWAASKRNDSSSIDPIQRRTCPLIGCGSQFLDPERMLQHLLECSKLSEGLYRCTYCILPQELDHHLAHAYLPQTPPRRRLSSVANPLRIAKRLFSHRKEKTRSFADASPVQSPAQWRSEFESTDPTYNFTTRVYSPDDFPVPWIVYEMPESSEPTELPDDASPSSIAYPLGAISELGNQNNPSFNFAELESGYGSSVAAQSQSSLETVNEQPYHNVSVENVNNDYLVRRFNTTRRPMRRTSFSPYQTQQGSQSSSSTQSYMQTSRNAMSSRHTSDFGENSFSEGSIGFVSQLNQTRSPTWMTRNPTISSMGSGQSFSLMDGCVSPMSMTRDSTVSEISTPPTRDSSLPNANLNASHNGIGHSQPFGSFFPGNEQTMIYDEPEAMESDFRAELDGFDAFKNTETTPSKAAPAPIPEVLENSVPMNHADLDALLSDLSRKQVPFPQVERTTNLPRPQNPPSDSQSPPAPQVLEDSWQVDDVDWEQLILECSQKQGLSPQQDGTLRTTPTSEFMATAEIQPSQQSSSQLQPAPVRVSPPPQETSSPQASLKSHERPPSRKRKRTSKRAPTPQIQILPDMPQPTTTPAPPPPLPPSLPSPMAQAILQSQCCPRCGHTPTGKDINKRSNLMRHIRTCHRPAPSQTQTTKRQKILVKSHKCHVCGKGYGRSDNLLYHQKRKGHLESVTGVELDVGSMSPREVAEGENVEGFDLLSASLTPVSEAGSGSGFGLGEERGESIGWHFG